MAVMDEFKEEREKIKTASPKQKWKYFKDYYLVGVVIAIAILAIIISVIHSILTHKDDALYVCMINFAAEETAQEGVTGAFTERSGIDTKREQIFIEESLYISPELDEDIIDTDSGNYSMADAMKYRYEDEQRLAALVITGSVDLIITGEDVFHRFVLQEYFAPLDLVYSAEQLQRYADEERLIYQDGKAVGIYMDDAPLIGQYYRYNGEEGQRIVAGYLYGSKHPELAMDFLDFLEGR